MLNQFDAIIIGAGQAGPPLAGRLTEAGMKVALIERKLFGGTCVNTGCTPTKALIASAHAVHLTRRGADFGFTSNSGIEVQMSQVMERAHAISGNSRISVEKNLRDMQSCTVFQAQARFEGPNTVRVGEQLLSAPRIFINVGGRASVPKLPGIDDVKFLTNSSILQLKELPEHLLIVGGSYVGLEFAQMFRRFGSRVTVIERGPHLVPREDEDISGAIREILVREDIAILTSAECMSFAPHENGVTLGLHCTAGEPTLVGSHVLLAVGRRPNTDDLGLEKAGVAIDSRGYIKVDDGLATTAPGIWALGDCNGRGAFTHTAYNDFEIVAANLIDGEHRRVSDRIPGYALYLDPPLGRVGLTEKAVRESGKPFLIGSRPMSVINRAIEKGETQGFMKILVDSETRLILGAAILGVGGDEAIHGILDTMNSRLPYDTLARAVPIHPTISELIPTVLKDLHLAAKMTRAA
jgi:pyruvate/2-oxoglutarate dehydrogenase complex dihydrolipoamide dehydrogenase (E3) component